MARYGRKERNPAMIPVTMSLSKHVAALIDQLVDLGISTSKSEYIRGAIYDRLIHEQAFLNYIETIADKTAIPLALTNPPSVRKRQKTGDYWVDKAIDQGIIQ